VTPESLEWWATQVTTALSRVPYLNASMLSYINIYIFNLHKLSREVGLHSSCQWPAYSPNTSTPSYSFILILVKPDQQLGNGQPDMVQSQSTLWATHWQSYHLKADVWFSNFTFSRRIVYNFWDIRHGNDNIGWNDLQMSFKVIERGTNQKFIYELLTCY